MPSSPVESLLDALSQVTDPRKRRGVRHPFTSILALTFLGLMCRQTEMAPLQRWAQDYWDRLRGPLGFTRQRPPHATTLSRVLARFSLAQLQEAFAQWLRGVIADGDGQVVAVDGKTSKQGHDAAGDPIHMLNVFAQRIKLCLAQHPVTAGKPTEPEVLKAHLAELLEQFPFIRLLTADALFTQRPLARLIVEADRDFLFVLKDNQPDVLEAVTLCFAEAAAMAPDAKTVEKRGRRSIQESFGSTSQAPRTMSASSAISRG
jgi:hypothetical protein